MLKKTNKKINRSGFTLMEVIIVMVIIGVLVTLAVPRFGKFREKAKLAQIQNDSKVLHTFVSMHTAEKKKDFSKGGRTELFELAKDNIVYKNGDRLSEGDIDIGGEVFHIEKSYVTKNTSTILTGEFYTDEDLNIYYSRDADLIYDDSHIIIPGDNEENDNELENGGEDVIVPNPEEEDNDAGIEEDVVDKTELEDAIDKGKNESENNYDEKGWSDLEDAITKGEEVLEDDKATQEEVDQAIKDIEDAMKESIVATDDDFKWIEGSGYNVESEENRGHYRYIGDKKNVSVPSYIQGDFMTDYYGMFQETDVEKVISTNTNIIRTSNMFLNSKAGFLDVSELDTRNVTSMNSMFKGVEATDIKFGNMFDTSAVTDMDHMFENSKTEFDMGSLDTFNTQMVTGMKNMFSGSTSRIIPVRNFKTGNVRRMTNMFYNTRNAQNIEVSGFDTRNVWDMDYMFQSSAVFQLDMRRWNTLSLTHTRGMFAHASRLGTLGNGLVDLTSFNFRNISLTNMDMMLSNVNMTTIKVNKIADKEQIERTGSPASKIPTRVNVTSVEQPRPPTTRPPTTGGGGSSGRPTWPGF